MDKEARSSLVLTIVLSVLALGQNMTSLGGYWLGWGLIVAAALSAIFSLLAALAKHLEWQWKMLTLVIVGSVMIAALIPASKLVITSYWGELDFCGAQASPCSSDVNCHGMGNCYNWAFVDKPSWIM